MLFDDGKLAIRVRIRCLFFAILRYFCGMKKRCDIHIPVSGMALIRVFRLLPAISCRPDRGFLSAGNSADIECVY